MSKETSNHAEKFAGIDKDIAGLQHAIRNSNEQVNQALSMLGTLRLELDAEQAKVKALILQLEQVVTHLNKNRI